MNRCDAISNNMTTYKNLYYYLEGTFDGCEVSHVSRASNEEADNLANIGSQCLPIPPRVFWEEIIERSIKSSKNSTSGEPTQHPTTGSGANKSGPGSTTEPEEIMMIEETWMQPDLAYMINKKLPEDTVEARKIIRRSKAFVVVQGKLYKKSITGVLQRCVTPQEGQQILKNIHAGACGHHASSRAITAKAFRAGFYWLTAIEDAKDIVRRCEVCRFVSLPLQESNIHGVLFLCRNPTFRKNPRKYCKIPILLEDPRSQKTRQRGAGRQTHHQGARPRPGRAGGW
jgi:hypothetical protein